MSLAAVHSHSAAKDASPKHWPRFAFVDHCRANAARFERAFALASSASASSTSSTVRDAALADLTLARAKLFYAELELLSDEKPSSHEFIDHEYLVFLQTPSPRNLALLQRAYAHVVSYYSSQKKDKQSFPFSPSLHMQLQQGLFYEHAV